MPSVEGTVSPSMWPPLADALVEVYTHPEAVSIYIPGGNPQKRIAGCMTDPSGKFKLSVPSGDYEVRVSYPGYQVLSFNIKVRKWYFFRRRQLKAMLAVPD